MIDSVLHFQTRHGFMLLLDWSKAYDRVNFDWLSYVLRKYGFPPNIISVLERCFYNQTATVSVNQNEAHIQIRQTTISFRYISTPLYCATFSTPFAQRERFYFIVEVQNKCKNGLYGQKYT